jgi:hypothetical protein
MDTMIEADVTGHYRALLWKEDNKAWTVDQALGIHVNVQVSVFTVMTLLRDFALFVNR